MWIFGYLLVGAGIVLTLIGAAAGLWNAAEGARIGSRSTHQAEEAVFDESMDMDQLQGDYVEGMGAQISGLTEVAIAAQAAVAPDVSLGTPGLSEGITFGSLSAQDYEDAQQEDDSAEGDEEAEDPNAAPVQDAEPVMFTGTIEVVLTGAAGNDGTGSMTIVVEDGGVVSGTLTNTWEDPSGDGGPHQVTQTGAFTGSITVENEITASGTVRTVAVGTDKTLTSDMVMTIAASPTDESMKTWTVVAGPEGGEMTTFVGDAR